MTVPVERDAAGRLVQAAETPALPVFLGYGADGELAGAVVTAQGMGYQDIIRVLYSYSFDRRAIVGFKVLESKETVITSYSIHYTKLYDHLSVPLVVRMKGTNEDLGKKILKESGLPIISASYNFV